MGTKIEIEHKGRTIWTKEDDNILYPKDNMIKFDTGVVNPTMSAINNLFED